MKKSIRAIFSAATLQHTGAFKLLCVVLLCSINAVAKTNPSFVSSNEGNAKRPAGGVVAMNNVDTNDPASILKKEVICSEVNNDCFKK